MSRWYSYWSVGYCIGLTVLVMASAAATFSGQSLELLNYQDGAPRWPTWGALIVFSGLWSAIYSFMKRERML